jgi:hypothetical protein
MVTACYIEDVAAVEQLAQRFVPQFAMPTEAPDQVGFIGEQRVSSKLIQPKAIALLSGL